MVEHAGQAIAAAHRKNGQELVLTPARPLPPGDIVLRFAWSGPLDGNKLRGLYRFQSGGAWYVGSTFEATDARRMVPCFDEPAFKAPVILTLRVPKNLVAVSNAPVERRSPRRRQDRQGFQRRSLSNHSRDLDLLVGGDGRPIRRERRRAIRTHTRAHHHHRRQSATRRGDCEDRARSQ